MSEWKEVKLRDVIALIRNGTTEHQSDNVSEYPVTRIETISQGIIDYDRVMYLEKAKPEFQLISGDILYSHINSIQHIGKTAQYFAEKPLYHGMNLMLLRVKDGIDARFVFNILNTEAARRHSKNEAKPAINQASLGQNEILRFSFDLPSLLPEQRKIAHILTTIDAVIEKTEAAIAKYEAIKKGMMADLFTRGIDPTTGKMRPRYEDAPDLYKATELGWVPKAWEVPKIGDIAVHVGSGVTPTGGSEVYKNEGVLFIRSQNVHFEGLYLDDVAFLSNETHDNMQRSKVLPNDVLLNITGASIGRCCYFPAKLMEANVNQHVCIIRVEKPNESKAIYLSQVLSSYIGQDQIHKLNAGGNREGLNYQQLRSFWVPWPRENSEIERMANMLQSVNSMIDKEKATLFKSHLLKQGLMADLLAGRVRVQVAEEPAAEMAEVANG